MNRQGQIPRSRGGICGVLLIVLGLWGGLAPFVGPYFHFGFTPDTTWHYNQGRLYYSIVPGAAALLGGLLVAGTRNRGVGVAGGLLGALGGAWFVAGSSIVIEVLKRSVSAGVPILTATSGGQSLRAYLETVALFTGLGILILATGGVAMGRFSLVAAKDLAAAADADTYYSDYPAAPYTAGTAASYPAGAAASQPDLSQYPTTVSPFGGTPADPATTTSQTPSGSPFPPAQFPSGQFPPGQFPDTTTGTFPPPDSPS